MNMKDWVKVLSLSAMALSLWIGLCAGPRMARADEYDESQSHPLRITVYLLHPLGRLAEWTVARPLHALVSSPAGQYIFGHEPHSPLIRDRSRTYSVDRDDSP